MFLLTCVLDSMYSVMSVLAFIWYSMCNVMSVSVYMLYDIVMLHVFFVELLLCDTCCYNY